MNQKHSKTLSELYYRVSGMKKKYTSRNIFVYYTYTGYEYAVIFVTVFVSWTEQQMWNRVVGKKTDTSKTTKKSYL